MDRLVFLIILFTSLQSCNPDKRSPELIELQPKSIEEVRQERLYEYDKTKFYYYNNFEKNGKNIFFSNVKPDYIIKSKQHKPLGLNTHMTRNPEVLEYFDKKLNNEFVYYHYRNDSLVSRLYLIENSLPKQNKKKRRLITSSEDALKLLDSLKIKYTDKGQCFDNNEKLIWIENKYPTYIYASKGLFYIEMYYKNFKTMGYNSSLHFN